VLDPPHCEFYKERQGGREGEGEERQREGEALFLINLTSTTQRHPLLVTPRRTSLHLLSMTLLSINCLLEKESTSFEVQGPVGRPVSILKDLIKAKLSPRLDAVTAMSLTLWRVQIAEEKAFQLNSDKTAVQSQDGDIHPAHQLAPGYKAIEEFFPQQPEAGIHIIVRLPGKYHSLFHASLAEYTLTRSCCLYRLFFFLLSRRHIGTGACPKGAPADHFSTRRTWDIICSSKLPDLTYLSSAMARFQHKCVQRGIRRCPQLPNANICSHERICSHGKHPICVQYGCWSSWMSFSRDEDNGLPPTATWRSQFIVPPKGRQSHSLPSGGEHTTGLTHSSFHDVSTSVRNSTITTIHRTRPSTSSNLWVHVGQRIPIWCSDFFLSDLVSQNTPARIKGVCHFPYHHLGSKRSHTAAKLPVSDQAGESGSALESGSAK